MSFRIRPANAADAEALALVGSATFLETYAGLLDAGGIIAYCRDSHSVAVYDDYLRSGATAWLAEATIGDAPIGFALMGATALPGSATDGSDVELKRIYAFSRFHGTGLGTQLLRHAIDAARLQASRLLLGVYTGNPRAIAFYAKQGFTQIATRRFRIGTHDYDDIVLALPLS